MKKYGFIFALIALTFGLNAQNIKEESVPAPVKNGLSSKFKDINNVKWEKEGDAYEAEFDFQKKEYSVLLNAAGNIVETEVEIPVSELPAGVKDYVATHHKGMKIKEASKKIDAAGLTSYEAEVGKADLIFDANGMFLKSETDTEDKDED